MEESVYDNLVSLDTTESIWSHFFTVAPLVVIGTKENETYDLAPKHMVTALGHDNFFGFVCTPNHTTYHNVKKHKEFTVSFIQPNQVVLASLASTPRCNENNFQKKIVEDLPTVKSNKIDALWVKDSYLILECTLHQIIDGFGEFSLISGKIIGAHVHEDSLKRSNVDDGQMIHKMPLLAYLAYGRFAEIKNSNIFPFPKGFDQKVLITDE